MHLSELDRIRKQDRQTDRLTDGRIDRSSITLCLYSTCIVKLI